MVDGILRFINFAPGDIIMLGAFAEFYLAPENGDVLPMPSIGGGARVIGNSMAICAVVNIVIEKHNYRPLRRRSKMAVLITAIGVSLTHRIHLPERPYVFGAAPQRLSALNSSHHVPTRRSQCLNGNQIVVLPSRFDFVARAAAVHRAENKNRHGHARLSFNPEAAALAEHQH